MNPMPLATGLALVLAMSLAFTAGPASAAGGHTLANSRLSILFGSDINGYTTADNDRVDAIAWVDSAGATRTGYVAFGGPLHCGDAQEFFGEAYGDNLDVGVPLPNLVIGGVTSAWTGTGALKGNTAVKSLASCDTALDATTRSTYLLSAKASLVNTMKVTRTFTFSASPASGNIRAYVPRVPLGTFSRTLYPNAAGVVQSVLAQTCPLNCTVTDWNGKWMADDDGLGNGVAVFRDAVLGPPAQLTVDWDGYSASNNSAITLTMPAAGWSGSVTETEYLCFYDAASWPAARRDKGLPPTGCTGVPH
jgi:hypothetical protein